MEKSISQELSESGFYTIFDVLDFIDARMKKADDDNWQHYRFVKSEIDSHIVDILKHRPVQE